MRNYITGSSSITIYYSIPTMNTVWIIYTRGCLTKSDINNTYNKCDKYLEKNKCIVKFMR